MNPHSISPLHLRLLLGRATSVATFLSRTSHTGKWVMPQFEFPFSTRSRHSTAAAGTVLHAPFRTLAEGLVRAADGHHRRRPRIACRRLTLFTRGRVFFSKCELAHTSQKFRGIRSTASGSAKKWRRAVETNQVDKFQRTTDSGGVTRLLRRFAFCRHGMGLRGRRRRSQ